MSTNWPEVLMVDTITGDTIARHHRPVVPRQGEIFVDTSGGRWRVGDVIHTGMYTMVRVHLIPILELQEVPSGDNSGD